MSLIGQLFFWAEELAAKVPDGPHDERLATLVKRLDFNDYPYDFGTAGRIDKLMRQPHADWDSLLDAYEKAIIEAEKRKNGSIPIKTNKESRAQGGQAPPA